MRKPNKYAHMADGTVLVMLERRDGSVLPCVVEAADWPNVRGYRWSARKGCNTFYVQTAGALRPDGKKTNLVMHRLLLPDAVMVDHRDLNGLNNRRRNLREATVTENNRNRSKPKTGVTSQYKGARWCKDAGKFRAEIRVNGKSHHLGYFTNQEDAARAYNAAALQGFGEFAKLNDLQPTQVKKAA